MLYTFISGFKDKKVTYIKFNNSGGAYDVWGELKIIQRKARADK